MSASAVQQQNHHLASSQSDQSDARKDQENKDATTNDHL